MSSAAGRASNLNAISMADRDALYDSVPLEPATKQIRLLKLFPGQEGSIIRGELFAASLEGKPGFEALSYAWGSPGTSRLISVNNHSLGISAGLHVALQAIRRKFCILSPITLWIDAICINQRNDGEKNTQVPLMSEIYTNAWRVIIWLGDGDAFDGLAMTVMRDVVARGGLDEAPKGDGGDPSALTGTEWIIQSLPPGSSLGQLLESLSALALRPWFRRTWILQEVSLPRADPLVLCGDFSLCWDCFRLGFRDLSNFFVLHMVRTFQMLLPEDDPRMPRVQDHLDQFERVTNPNDIMYISRLRWSVQAGRHETDIPFETMLWEATRTMATDARDKVYGLLALAPAAAWKQIVVDYASDLASVNTQVVRYSFSTGGFGILSCAGIANGTHDPAWPTWLPRFDHPLQSPPLPATLTRSDFRPRSVYNASHHLPNFHHFLDKGRLVLYGLPVDRVSRLGANFHPTGTKWVDLFDCLFTFSHAAKRCGECHTCQTVPAGEQWEGPDEGTGEPEPGARWCREPLYAPCIPTRPPRAATEAYVDVLRQQNAASGVDSSSWIKQDGDCSVSDPSEKASDRGEIPWGYSTSKPFRDVLWRAFIGDYLDVAPGDAAVEVEKVPAPPDARGTVLEVVWDKTGKGPNEELGGDISFLWSLVGDMGRSAGYSDGGETLEKFIVDRRGVCSWADAWGAL